MKTILSIIILVVYSFSSMAQSSVNLKYNLAPNKTYRVKSTTKVEQKMTMQGMDQNTEVNNMLYFSIKPLNSSADFFMAQVRFDTIFFSTSMPKMEVSSANSGNMKSSDAKEIMDCFENRLSNSTLLVKMDYSGHVIDIMNYQVIEKVLLTDIDSIRGQAEMSIKPRIIMMAEKEALKGMIESITVYAPNKEVKKGDSWETSFKSKNGGFGMLINSVFVLDNLEENEASLHADVAITPAADKPMEINGAKITADIKGIGKSEMKINTQTAWIISSSATMEISGNMNVEAQGQQFQMPLEIKSTSELTAIE